MKTNKPYMRPTADIVEMQLGEGVMESSYIHVGGTGKADIGMKRIDDAESFSIWEEE